MCKWGTDTIVRVPIPANLSHTGQFRWDNKSVDSCIADLVSALNKDSIYTSGCCCGHYNTVGWITLHDGRNLLVTESEEEARLISEFIENLRKEKGKIT